MIRLRAVGVPSGLSDTHVGRVRREPALGNSLLVMEPISLGGTSLGESAVLLTETLPDRGALESLAPCVSNVDSLGHLVDGDIVAVHPSGRIDTLFRVASPNNSLFVTERCNSKCLMCSQPPRLVDDIDYFITLNSTLVPLLPKSLPTLGITGGEPTLLGDGLVQLIRLVATELPATQLEILSNGRAFSRPSIARAVGRVATSKVLFSIPLYSDFGPQHDYVVQARDAFGQTVLGLHNLARFGVRSEIRVVLHRQSVIRLPSLARFIHKNLTFVEHVALMGMEHTGYARMHDEALWMDPPEYASELENAVDYLSSFGYQVSVYNLQPCLVPPALWPFLRSSISDWKREYLSECDRCTLRSECGGVFGTSRRQSQLIRAIVHHS